MCGRIYSYQHSAGEWDDVPCNMTNTFLCETKKSKEYPMLCMQFFVAY